MNDGIDVYHALFAIFYNMFLLSKPFTSILFINIFAFDREVVVKYTISPFFLNSDNFAASFFFQTFFNDS